MFYFIKSIFKKLRHILIDSISIVWVGVSLYKLGLCKVNCFLLTIIINFYKLKKKNMDVIFNYFYTLKKNINYNFIRMIYTVKILIYFSSLYIILYGISLKFNISIQYLLLLISIFVGIYKYYKNILNFYKFVFFKIFFLLLFVMSGQKYFKNIWNELIFEPLFKILNSFFEPIYNLPFGIPLFSLFSLSVLAVSILFNYKLKAELQKVNDKLETKNDELVTLKSEKEIKKDELVTLKSELEIKKEELVTLKSELEIKKEELNSNINLIKYFEKKNLDLNYKNQLYLYSDNYKIKIFQEEKNSLLQKIKILQEEKDSILSETKILQEEKIRNENYELIELKLKNEKLANEKLVNEKLVNDLVIANHKIEVNFKERYKQIVDVSELDKDDLAFAFKKVKSIEATKLETNLKDKLQLIYEMSSTSYVIRASAKIKYVFVRLIAMFIFSEDENNEFARLDNANRNKKRLLEIHNLESKLLQEEPSYLKMQEEKESKNENQLLLKK